MQAFDDDAAERDRGRNQQDERSGEHDRRQARHAAALGERKRQHLH